MKSSVFIFHRLESIYRDRVVETNHFLSLGHLPYMLKYRRIGTEEFISKLALYTMPNNDTTEYSLKEAPLNPYKRRLAQHPGTTNISMRESGSYRPMTEKVEDIPTFREFVLYAVDNVLRCNSDLHCLEYLDDHIAPQVATCNPCLLPFDVIIKVRIYTAPVQKIM